MAAMYDHLRVLSFRIRREDLSSIRYWHVGFPRAWREIIRELAAIKANRPLDQVRLPISTLNSAIRALVPSVVAVGSDADLPEARPWLFARERLDSAGLLQIVRSWAGVHYGELPGYQHLYESMHVEHLSGGYADLPLDLPVERGGTAKPDNLMFSVVPNQMAANLVASGRWTEVEDQPRDLVRVVGGAGSHAEVMTWPPYAYTRKDGDWHFSAVFRFTLQTVPFDPEPVMNLEFAVRRWLRGSKTGYFQFPGGQNTMLYMRPRVHWMGESVNPECFQVAPIGWLKDGKDFRLQWRDQLGRLMARLAWPRAPTLDSLHEDPTCRFDHDVAMAIVFDTGAEPRHKVRPGWMPADRRPMFDAVAERLANWLAPVDLLERFEPPSPKPRKQISVEMPPKPADEEGQKQWNKERDRRREQAGNREHIDRALAGRRHIDILYQNTDTLHALRDALTELLGVPVEEDGDSYRWAFSATNLVVNYRRLGALGAELAVHPCGDFPSSNYLKCLAERAKFVRSELATRSAEAAIIELQGKESFSKDGQGGDPKAALRKGAAMAGRVTQFIMPPKPSTDAAEDDEEGDLGHRARAAWKDLFRQLGVTSGALDIAPADALPAGLQYVGVWLVNTNRRSDRLGIRVPVMVRLTADGSPVLARVGVPEMPEWIPYADALRRLAALDQVTYHAAGQDTVAQFISTAVKQDLLGEGPVLLMASSQNLRHTWKWLANGQLVRDYLHLPPGSPRPITDWPGLRFVRVRVSDNGETPEAYGEASGTIGFPKGQWRWSERVFFSTASKPDAMKTLSALQSRFRPYQTATKDYLAAPGKSAWNPALLELTAAALQPGDDPVQWANLAHQLRFVAWHFDDPLSLPLPLHLARRLEEYIVPISAAQGHSNGKPPPPVV